MFILFVYPLGNCCKQTRLLTYKIHPLTKKVETDWFSRMLKMYICVSLLKIKVFK